MRRGGKTQSVISARRFIRRIWVASARENTRSASDTALSGPRTRTIEIWLIGSRIDSRWQKLSKSPTMSNGESQSRDWKQHLDPPSILSTFKRELRQFSRRAPRSPVRERIMSSNGVLSLPNQLGQPRNVITRPRTDVFYAREGASLPSRCPLRSLHPSFRQLYHARTRGWSGCQLLTWECRSIKVFRRIQRARMVKRSIIFLLIFIFCQLHHSTALREETLVSTSWFWSGNPRNIRKKFLKIPRATRKTPMPGVVRSRGITSLSNAIYVYMQDVFTKHILSEAFARETARGFQVAAFTTRRVKDSRCGKGSERKRERGRERVGACISVIECRRTLSLGQRE